MKKLLFVITLVIASGASLVYFYNKNNRPAIIPDIVSMPLPLPEHKTCQVVVRGNKKVGYFSLTDQVQNIELKVDGTVPAWLSGSLLKTGPALFEIGKTSVKHWFDGFAMLFKCTINKGKILYSNALLESEYYTTALKAGTLSSSITGEKKSFFSKISSLSKEPDVYDNATINIIQQGGSCLALGETPFHNAFDPHTLGCKGCIHYTDTLEGHMCTPHPIIDSERKELINILLEFGTTSVYHIYRQSLANTHRELITDICVKRPSYVHSFAVTPHYIIVILCPFTVNPVDLLLSGKPFIENFVWKKEDSSTFYIINRQSGVIEKTLQAEAFFMFHTVNAYEEDNTVILDIAAYKDAGVMKETQLEYLRNRTQASENTSYFTRFTIDVPRGALTTTSNTKQSFEMPSFNQAYAGRPYTYAYGANNDITCISKINTKTMSIEHTWQANDCFVGEPTFVAAPNSTREDQGVLLSIILDTAKKQSFLVILDAQTLKELARAWTPHAIPFGFHATFLEKF
jgi:carotenoid cleavage dioxygenase-like enzyme